MRAVECVAALHSARNGNGHVIRAVSRVHRRERPEAVASTWHPEGGRANRTSQCRRSGAAVLVSLPTGEGRDSSDCRDGVSAALSSLSITVIVRQLWNGQGHYGPLVCGGARRGAREGRRVRGRQGVCCIPCPIRHCTSSPTQRPISTAARGSIRPDAHRLCGRRCTRLVPLRPEGLRQLSLLPPGPQAPPW